MNKPIVAAKLDHNAVSLHSANFRDLFDLLAEGEASREEHRTLPHAELDLIRKSRLGAVRVPRDAGGGGFSIRELLKTVIELGSADANIAHILRNHFSVVERLVRNPFSEQSQLWQNAVVDGAIIGLASTELSSPQVGNITPDTTLTPDGDGFVLNGTKYYSTGSLFADLILVRTAVHGKSSAAVLIPATRAGVERLDDWDGMGQRLTGSGTTHFHNVSVESGEVVHDDGVAGYGVAYSNTFAQLFLTAINAGIARAVHRDAVKLVKGRGRNFYYAPAERTAEDPLLQEAVGYISSNAFAAETVVLAAADALDLESNARERGEDSSSYAATAALLSAQAKLITDQLATLSATKLFDVGGASATKRSTNLDRHWRNARTLASHNPGPHKARAIGDLEINGTPLPSKGFF